jgi:hypothetical protein
MRPEERGETAPESVRWWASSLSLIARGAARGTRTRPGYLACEAPKGTPRHAKVLPTMPAP